jgi:hypothetical protein
MVVSSFSPQETSINAAVIAARVDIDFFIDVFFGSKISGFTSKKQPLPLLPVDNPPKGWVVVDDFAPKR